MWGCDEEAYKREVIEEAKGYMGVEIGDDDEYVTKDSGEKAVHTDGVQRDTNKGKILFPLMFPKGVPMKDQLIVRLAELYTRGAVKYGDRNWENSSAEDTLEHHLDALWRHFMNYYFEVEDGEDHAAAILWNVNAVDLTRRNIKAAQASQPAQEQVHDQINPVEPPPPTSYGFAVGGNGGAGGAGGGHGGAGGNAYGWSHLHGGRPRGGSIG